MMTENSTADEVSSNTTKATINYTTKAAAFFDPTWQHGTIEFPFKCAVIAVGIFGTAANALVLYALIAYQAREIKKRAINLLMIHQNLLDLSACLLLVITFSIKVSNIYLTGATGYFLCTIFISENSTNCTLNASIINLMPVVFLYTLYFEMIVFVKD